MADRLLIGYARCSTEGQDLTAQRQALTASAVAAGLVHGYTVAIGAAAGLLTVGAAPAFLLMRVPAATHQPR